MCSIIAPDKKEQRRILRVGVQGVKQAATSWGSLQHVQLLCSSYRASQEQLWGSAQDATAAPVGFCLACCCHESVIKGHIQYPYN